MAWGCFSTPGIFRMVLMDHGVLFFVQVKHMTWFKDSGSCECRCRRASLLPSRLVGSMKSSKIFVMLRFKAVSSSILLISLHQLSELQLLDFPG
jgi:hypothetical protein